MRSRACKHEDKMSRIAAKTLERIKESEGKMIRPVETAAVLTIAPWTHIIWTNGKNSAEAAHPFPICLLA